MIYRLLTILFLFSAASVESPAQRRSGTVGRDTLTITGDSIGEVVVTARESGGMTSSSRIDRAAMEHLQPTSFTDLLELLPGNISQDPNMGAVNSITLRETGTLGTNGNMTADSDFNISSLGTLFYIDGAPLNGDANMQNVPGSKADASAPEYKRDMTNKGVDMRTISTDNIESVEIVRGIPSAEYGNLTSGFVNIRRIHRATPLNARFKADGYSKLFSIGKGVALGDMTTLNADLSWLDSKTDPRDRLENYKRLTASARLDGRTRLSDNWLSWSAGADYTGSFDNSKSDPDLSYRKLDEYRSSYNRFAFTGEMRLAFNHAAWIDRLSLNTSVSYQRDRLERRKQVAPQRAAVAPSTMDEGEHDGRYLLSEYVADYVCDGQPMNVFVKMKADGSRTWRKTTADYKLGMEWTMSKNYGRGQIYDLGKPLSASWSTRPVNYNDIPGLHIVSLYAEEKLSATLPAGKMEVQTGIRTISCPSLPGRYYMSGRIYADPRLNLVWRLPAFADGDIRMLIAGGYGVTTKMPTVDYLYPQKSYDDILQLNYYDIDRPKELSRVNIRTYIDDATNYALRPARNHKWEIRIGLDFKGNSLSATYFNERMNDGFRYSATYVPREYRKYDASAIDPNTLTAPPDLSCLPYTDEQVLRGHSYVSNGSRIDKQGVELQLTTARWKVLHTGLTVTGAWFRTTYSNSQMLCQTVSDVVDNTPVSDRYVGLYDTDDGRVNEQLNTNFMFDTQVPRHGFIFTTTLQCMWYVKTKRMWQNGTPVAYIDADDGLTHEYTRTSAEDHMLKYLIRNYNSDIYRTQRVPMALYVNLKATKTIGKRMRLAIFVNRIIDHLPDYRSNGLTVRRSSSPYFGMEMNLKL